MGEGYCSMSCKIEFTTSYNSLIKIVKLCDGRLPGLVDVDFTVLDRPLGEITVSMEFEDDDSAMLFKLGNDLHG